MSDLSQLVRLGCAGWSIPSREAEHFPSSGTHLERYAQRLPAVEINTSFYRPHRPATYARWAASVPDWFQFAVKVPRAITHSQRLRGAAEPLDRFLAEIALLGPKLGPLLVQLPPSMRFDGADVEAFFTTLRARFQGGVVCEPRHASWFSGETERVLIAAQVARGAADPPPVPEAARPGGWPGLVYHRLHGSPEMYMSAYPQASLDELGEMLREAARSAPTWCIFDNTAEGEAMANALYVRERLTPKPREGALAV